MNQIKTISLPNGITLLVEENHAVRSAGFNWLLPLGNAYDHEDQLGTSTLLADWLWRGAAELDTRQLSDAFDRVGLQRGTGVETHHLTLSAVMIGSKMPDALPLLVSLITTPTLGSNTFEQVRDLCLQSIDSLRDDPPSRAMITLKEKYFPSPFNRSTYGNSEHLKQLTPDQATKHWHDHAIPAGSIISISGNADAQHIKDQLTTLLDNWHGNAKEPQQLAQPPRGYTHIHDDSAQCHLALAFAAPEDSHHDSMLQRIATAVLSGGMSGRLFTEVREKRSLCYSVYASYAAGRDRGAVFSYAGTTPERAQETLEVTVNELHRLHDGITQSEFHRAVTGVKSRLIMHGESTSARAASLAHDYYNHGKPRTLDEIAQQVDAVTLDQVNHYLTNNPIQNITIVSLGPTKLNPPK